jgi:hypothetical protein
LWHSKYAVTTSPTPPSSGTLTANSTVTVTGLSSSTTYYAYVRSVCSGIGNSPWISQTFATAIGSCTPQYSNTCSGGGWYYFIKRFTLKGEGGSLIHKEAASCSSNYIDYTATTNATLGRGKSYSCIISTDTLNSCSAWIDFNDDNAFTSDEKVLSNYQTAFTLQNNQVSLYIPALVNIGSHRMRVRLNSDDPCATGFYGQAHDYTVTIEDSSSSSAYTISPGIANNCLQGGSVIINAACNNNTKWVPLVDSSNNIIASINANGNNLNRVDVSEYINKGTVRTSTNGRRYLDRNTQITVQTQPASVVGIRIYLSQRELDSLKAVDPSISSVNDLWLTKTNQSCGSVLGQGQVLQPVGSGTINGGYYVEYNITSFSSFYLHSGSCSTNVWTGAVNSVWENPSNWSCGIIPTSTTNVVIGAGFNIIINTNVTVNTLAIGTGSNLTVTAGHTLTVVH